MLVALAQGYCKGCFKMLTFLFPGGIAVVSMGHQQGDFVTTIYFITLLFWALGTAGRVKSTLSDGFCGELRWRCR